MVTALVFNYLCNTVFRGFTDFNIVTLNFHFPYKSINCIDLGATPGCRIQLSKTKIISRFCKEGIFMRKKYLATAALTLALAAGSAMTSFAAGFVSTSQGMKYQWGSGDYCTNNWVNYK